MERMNGLLVWRGREADAVGFDGDAFGAEQGADDLFEGAFGNAEFVMDFLGGGMVADGPEAAAE